MPIDLSRLEERRRRIMAQRSVETTAQANMVTAVGERAETLRLSEVWRVWEDHVRSLLATDEQQANVLELTVLDPFAAVDQVLQHRTTLMYLKGRLDARRQDLELPAELARRGSAAQRGVEASKQ